MFLERVVESRPWEKSDSRVGALDPDRHCLRVHCGHSSGFNVASCIHDSIEFEFLHSATLAQTGSRSTRAKFFFSSVRQAGRQAGGGCQAARPC